jgi:hypothetical protein
MVFLPVYFGSIPDDSDPQILGYSVPVSVGDSSE